MDDNTRSHIKEELGLALGHLHRAHDNMLLDNTALERDSDYAFGLWLGDKIRELSTGLNSLTEEVQSGR